MGKNLVYVPECHSTNTLASDLCQRTPATEGTLIITHNQTQGRGQRGNHWISEAGKNLTFSVVLKPDFLRPIDQFYLTMAISLGICDFISRHPGLHAQIKWPNDVLIRERKVCGILIENVLSGDSIQYSIVGIGLNVNQDKFDLLSATSLRQASGETYDLAVELEMLLVELENRYRQLQRLDLAGLKRDYLRLLFAKDELRLFDTAAGHVPGIIVGVTENGRLQVLMDGKTSVFDFKEIRLVL
jgi:BirA family transcriptional regulator, biotin operon repressor / biotin---[acetyl-CoA-carboxylase] ligase